MGVARAAKTGANKALHSDKLLAALAIYRWAQTLYSIIMMKTYPLKNEEGKLHAFEINNSWLSRNRVVHIAQGIPDVVIVRKPKMFSWFREEVFCEFKVGEQLFTVEEPFGDNSRFLVGAEPPGWCPQLELVEMAFREA